MLLTTFRKLWTSYSVLILTRVNVLVVAALYWVLPLKFFSTADDNVLNTDHAQLPALPNVMNILQLEALMRVHVMMSVLHVKGSSGHRQCSIAALAFCFQMWKVCLAIACTYLHLIPYGHTSANIECWSEKQWANYAYDHLGMGFISNIRSGIVLLM